MKNSIVLLGMAVLVFNLSSAANSSNSADRLSAVVENEQGDFFENNPLEKRNLAPVEDQVILNPAAVMTNVYQKSLEEIIAENNQIIESNITDEGVRYFQATSMEAIIQENTKITEDQSVAEIRPLYLDRTIEDQIAEDNAIIESEIVTLQPLDFETINKKRTALKQNSTLVGMN